MDEDRQQNPAEPQAQDEEQTVTVERLRTALADLEDAKLRIRKDAERQVELLRGRVLEALIPVLDNLERSIAAARSDDDCKASIVDGIRMVHQQFLGVLTQFGLERRSTVGERFDPRAHDAIAVVPVQDPNLDGVVVAETEPAYWMGDRVIRPAKVTVGRAADRPVA
jgi:molecular chaperone GrpE (heat shock protein)